MIQLTNVYDERGYPVSDACEFLYRLLGERGGEVAISHREMPGYGKHCQFVIGKPYRYWYLVEQRSTSKNSLGWIGAVNATWQNEVGVQLLSIWQGQGHGREAVRRFLATHTPNPAEPSVRDGAWLANIAPTNVRSQQFFAKLGFRHIQETWAYLEEEEDGHEEEDDQEISGEEAPHPAQAEGPT